MELEQISYKTGLKGRFGTAKDLRCKVYIDSFNAYIRVNKLPDSYPPCHALLLGWLPETEVDEEVAT